MQLLNSGECAGFCTLCQKTSVCVCQRCGDFYCSPQCQRKDWPRHRYICFPMPTLVRSDVSYRQVSDHESSNEGTEITSLNDGQKQHRRKPKTHTQQQQWDNSCGRGNSQKESNGNKEKQAAFSNSTSTPLPKPNSRVILTGFRTPNRCYVCSVSEIDDYFEVAKQINQYGKTAPLMTELPKPNSYAITHREEIMCRVVVLSVRDEKGIRVLFCDHGTTAVRHLSDLRVIAEDIVGLKQHTVLVQLRSVDNYAITEPLMRYLSHFEDAEFEIRYVNESGVKVELINWHTGKCLNNEIMEFSKNLEVYAGANSSGEKSDEAGDVHISQRLQVKYKNVAPAQEHKLPAQDENKPAQEERKPVVGKKKSVNTDEDQIPKQSSPSIIAASTPLLSSKTSPASPPSTSKSVPSTSKSAPSTSKSALPSTLLAPVLDAPFKTLPFDVTATNFKVIVTDNSCLEYGYFGCIAETDLRHLVQVQEYLNDFTDTKEPYEPKVNEFCIALYENEWYRAKVTEIPDDKHFNVIYLDFTNENQLTKDDIRRYPTDLTSDCRTTLCLIEGLPLKMTAVQLKFLHTEISYRSKITIDKTKSVNEEIVVVECHSIIQKLLGLPGNE